MGEAREKSVVKAGTPICHPLKCPHRLIHLLARGQVAVGIVVWVMDGHGVPLRMRIS